MNIQIATYGIVASDSLQPLWNYANSWGSYNNICRGEGVVIGKANYLFIDKKNFSLKAGFSGVLKSDFNNSFIQESFIRSKIWWFDISVGLEAYSPVIATDYNDNLTSGMYLSSNNARPIPRITTGIYNYLPVGFLHNWVDIRGFISQGYLGDEHKGVTKILLHEKAAYIRLGNLNIRPYAGLVHSALFGGTKPDGTKIPIDFWSTFLGKGSNKIGGGEATNAAGAHMGLWDFGIYYFFEKNWNFHFYLQKPFADNSGALGHPQNKDYNIGILLNSNGHNLFSGLSLEIFKTSFQSGLGTPDPYDPEENHIVLTREIHRTIGVDKYMMDRFGIETNGWTDADLNDFLSDEWNYGHPFNGRDDYMNNGMYYSGWTYHGLSTGIPLYHTTEQHRLYAPEIHLYDRVTFVNNRVDGFHIGFEGWISDNFYYRIKGTFTKNSGSYGEAYQGSRYNWNETPNYFFKTSKNQYYTGLKIKWDITDRLPLLTTYSLGYDFGELYKSVGARVGIVYLINQ